MCVPRAPLSASCSFSTCVSESHGSRKGEIRSRGMRPGALSCQERCSVGLGRCTDFGAIRGTIDLSPFPSWQQSGVSESGSQVDAPTCYF